VVTGYLLLLAFGRRGWFGPALAEIGIVLSFRWTDADLGECRPEPAPATEGEEQQVAGHHRRQDQGQVRAMRLSFEAVDTKLEQAAGTLGAAPAAIFLVVTHDADLGECRPEPAPATEGEEQQVAGHHRRQDQGRPTGKLAPCS
jgi:hypothetical protein